MEMELWDKPGKLKQCGLTVMMMTTMTTLVMMKMLKQKNVGVVDRGASE